MLQDDREELYRASFQTINIPIREMDIDKVLEPHPHEFHEEIKDAYLRYATFYVDLWTNYDAIAKKFFTVQPP